MGQDWRDDRAGQRFPTGLLSPATRAVVLWEFSGLLLLMALLFLLPWREGCPDLVQVRWLGVEGGESVKGGRGYLFK